MKKTASITTEHGTTILLYSTEENELHEEIENLRDELGELKVTVRYGRN